MNGIINAYKPSGISSAAAVGKIRHALGYRHVGHMGTLDPIGEGVLLVGIGKGARLFDYYLGKSKTYEATFKFGISSDTLDIAGNITDSTNSIPDASSISAALNSLVGKQEQLPPLYSAKSVGGVRAYELARKGIAVELKSSVITVNSFELLKEIGENEYLFRIDCSAGTYIRSLCRDLAEKLGSLAVMTSIKRTRCGKFFAENSIKLGDITPDIVVPLETALSDIERYDAPESAYKKSVNGVPYPADDAPKGEFALYCRNELIGLATVVDGAVKIKTYLKGDLK